MSIETPDKLRTGERSRTTPRHIALIMDGNGRWARLRKQPTVFGHRAGAEAVRRCVAAAISHGVDFLTLYAFSSENWRRAPDEVNDLKSLLSHYLRFKVSELHAQGVRLHVIGDLARFEPALVDKIRRAEALTRDNISLTLVLALSYGARADIVQAAQQLAQRVASGVLTLSEITESSLASCLQTHGIPDPDLVVRTSGEQRLSNFLLWESAYAELAFIDVLWPDFKEDHFAQLISDFSTRERRFGGRIAREEARCVKAK